MFHGTKDMHRRNEISGRTAPGNKRHTSEEREKKWKKVLRHIEPTQTKE